jgi:hypothetical protein
MYYSYILLVDYSDVQSILLILYCVRSMPCECYTVFGAAAQRPHVHIEVLFSQVAALQRL